MTRKLLYSTAALALLAVAPAAARDMRAPTVPSDMPAVENGQGFVQKVVATPQMAAPAAQEFVEKAAVANMFEIQSSMVVVNTAKNDEVKRFAQQMINDHTKAGEDFKAAVKEADLKAPDKLDAEHQQKVDMLQQASTANLDKQYVDMQVKAHDEAVALFTAYSQSGDNGTLKAFAQKTLPTLQQHQQMIHQISQTISS